MITTITALVLVAVAEVIAITKKAYEDRRIQNSCSNSYNQSVENSTLNDLWEMLMEVFHIGKQINIDDRLCCVLQ